VTYINLCSEEHDEERQFADGEALGDLTLILQKATDAELDELAEAAERALAAELHRKRTKQDPRRIGFLRYFMEDAVDGECSQEQARWSGNHRMDEVERAIGCYRAETGDRGGAIDLVLVHARDSRALELLLSIVADPQEDHLARIAALRHFEHHTLAGAEQDRLVKACLDIVSGAGAGVPVRGPVNDPSLVRVYAVLALHGYGNRPTVEEVLLRLLNNAEENGNVRESAFHVLCSYFHAPLTDAEDALIHRLLEDDALVGTVQTFLAYRRQQGKE
jgi:hypothetical protein